MPAGDSDRYRADRVAVVAVLERLADAWNGGDAAAYGHLFTEDADYITYFGVNLPGRDAIERAHRALFDGPLQGTRLSLTGEPVTVRFLGPDVAIMVATTRVASPDREPEGVSIQTLVVIRQHDGWRIGSFHNTRRTPAASDVNDARATG